MGVALCRRNLRRRRRAFSQNKRGLSGTTFAIIKESRYQLGIDVALSVWSGESGISASFSGRGED